MPIWFLAAFLATFLWAVVNLIDDNLLRNIYRSAAIGAVISGLFGFLPSFYLFATNERVITEPKIVLSAVSAGALTVVFYYFYFRTLDSDEPSVAIALNNLAAGIVPFMAFIFLGEVLQYSQYLGLAIIIVASLFLSILDIRKLHFSPAFLYAIFGAFAYATVSILAKYAYQGGTFREIYSWIAFGFGVGGLAFLIFGNKRAELKKLAKSAKALILIVLVAAEVINILAEITQGYAISAGPVSVVRGIEGTQPLFVLLLGVLLSPFFPKYFRESKDKRFTKKVACMFIMVVGLILIYQK